MVSTKRVLVINPNSNQSVTDNLSEALEPLRITGGPKIECVTLRDGPWGVETQAHIEQVTLPLREMVVKHDADAFVIACYSDPGLHVCREATAKPVFGIQENGILTALTRGDRFGVIALGPRSIARHLRYIRQMGVSERLAGERAVNLSVAVSEQAKSFDRLRAAGCELRDIDGADVLILGCAGMACHRQRLENELGIAVIDPTQAAVAQALGCVMLDAN